MESVGCCSRAAFSNQGLLTFRTMDSRWPNAALSTSDKNTSTESLPSSYPNVHQCQRNFPNLPTKLKDLDVVGNGQPSQSVRSAYADLSFELVRRML